MKISIKAENKVVTATLTDSQTTQDFISLLPLTLTMNDLFGREKFARLPRAMHAIRHAWLAVVLRSSLVRVQRGIPIRWANPDRDGWIRLCPAMRWTNSGNQTR